MATTTFKGVEYTITGEGKIGDGLKAHGITKIMYVSGKRGNALMIWEFADGKRQLLNGRTKIITE